MGASPIRQSLQPEAIGAVIEVTKWLNPHGVDDSPRDRRLERHCQELRNAFAVFRSAVSKPSLKRSYTDCRRVSALAIRP